MPLLTLTKPNRLSIAGQIFERDVATEVPLALFRELYETRRRQFDFAPAGIALMVGAAAEPPAAEHQAAEHTAADKPFKSGLVIRKNRKVAEPGPDSAPADTGADPGADSGAETSDPDIGVDV